MTPAALAFMLLAAAPPPWCIEAERELRGASALGADAYDELQRIVALFPPQTGPVIEAARGRAGDDGSLSATLALLDAAVADGCRDSETPLAADALSAEVRHILDDKTVFAGERVADDALDRFAQQVKDWLYDLLESDAMQRYAGASRFLYLAVLAIAASIIAVRLLRARRRSKMREDASAQGAATEQTRVRAASYWLQEAQARLARKEDRSALRAGQMAVLARLGEVDEGAVTPARTHAEVLERLDKPLADIVRPSLLAFERAFFGSQTDVAAADIVARLADAVRELDAARKR